MSLRVVALESALRAAPLPVIARVSQDSLHLDVLALDERDLEAVAESVAWAIDRVARPAGYAGPAADRVARPLLGPWPSPYVLSLSARPVTSTTARRRWSRPSPAATPTG